MYDSDGSGEIDPFEMEQIFTKLCKIAENSEKDQIRKSRREAQKTMTEAKEEREKQEALELKRLEQKQENDKNRVVVFSQNFKRVMRDKNQPETKVNLTRRKYLNSKAKEKEETEESKKKLANISDIAKELSNPLRDCRKFDQDKRAHDLFFALDSNNDGLISETEFIKGCTSDDIFVQLLTEFSGDFIWGYADC